MHRSLNRVYRNIIPTYEKYLGYKPPSRDDNPEGRDVTRFGGERPEFFRVRQRHSDLHERAGQAAEPVIRFFRCRRL